MPEAADDAAEAAVAAAAAAVAAEALAPRDEAAAAAELCSSFRLSCPGVITKSPYIDQQSSVNAEAGLVTLGSGRYLLRLLRVRLLWRLP